MSATSEIPQPPADKSGAGTAGKESGHRSAALEDTDTACRPNVLLLHHQAGQTVAGSPMADRVVLGVRLRRARDRKGLGLDRAAQRAACPSLSYSTLSRLETAKAPATAEIVEALADVYEVDEQERRKLLELAASSQRPDWFDAEPFVGSVPRFYRTYLGLEPVADELRSYQAMVIPGLAQTPAYARGIISRHHLAVDKERVEQHVAARVERQARLFGAPPKVTALVINELALTLPVGSDAVMAAQMRHLLHMADLPNVKIRIVPIQRTIATPTSGLTHLKFRPDGPPQLVYIEGNEAASYHFADAGEPSERTKGARKGRNASADMEKHVQLLLTINRSAVPRRRGMDIILEALRRYEGR